MTPKNKRIGMVMGLLVLLTAGSLVYFNGLLTPTNESAPLNQIASNAGTPQETDANGPAYAQFRAECVVKGQSYRGTVSVPSIMSSPRDLKAVELKTEAGDMIRFAQEDAQCTYSPN